MSWTQENHLHFTPISDCPRSFHCGSYPQLRNAWGAPVRDSSTSMDYLEGMGSGHDHFVDSKHHRTLRIWIHCYSHFESLDSQILGCPGVSPLSPTHLPQTINSMPNRKTKPSFHGFGAFHIFGGFPLKNRLFSVGRWIKKGIHPQWLRKMYIPILTIVIKSLVTSTLIY